MHEATSEPLSPQDREDVLVDLEDLEVFQTLLEPRGVRGLVVDCDECEAPHYFAWDLLRQNLRQLLDVGRIRAARARVRSRSGEVRRVGLRPGFRRRCAVGDRRGRRRLRHDRSARATLSTFARTAAFGAARRLASPSRRPASPSEFALLCCEYAPEQLCCECAPEQSKPEATLSAPLLNASPEQRRRRRHLGRTATATSCGRHPATS